MATALKFMQKHEFFALSSSLAFSKFFTKLPQLLVQLAAKAALPLSSHRQSVSR
jgi:hypothetical protein